MCVFCTLSYALRRFQMYQSGYDGGWMLHWDSMAYTCLGLLTWMHHAVDTRYEYTTKSRYPNTGPTSPGFTFTMMRVQRRNNRTSLNVLCTAQPGLETTISRLPGGRSDHYDTEAGWWWNVIDLNNWLTPCLRLFHCLDVLWNTCRTSTVCVLQESPCNYRTRSTCVINETVGIVVVLIALINRSRIN